MPLKSERIAPDVFLPWAANLLPENEQLRTLGQILGMNNAPTHENRMSSLRTSLIA